MRFFVLLALVGLAFGGCGGLQRSTSAQVDAVGMGNYFAIGGVGYAGVMSDGERELRATLKRPDASERLAREFRNGRPVKQLYALMGLRVVDRRKFEEFYSTVAKSKTVVKTMDGCSMGNAKVGVLAQEIAAGKYDWSFAQKTKAEEALVKASLFAIGKITDAGVLSEGEKALREILTQPHAMARLTRVSLNGTLAGKLYALLGVRQIDRQTFANIHPGYRDSREMVATMEGCLAGHETVGRIARKIAGGRYDRALRSGDEVSKVRRGGAAEDRITKKPVMVPGWTFAEMERGAGPVPTAEEILTAPGYFAVGGVGYGGTKSDGEKALRAILGAPGAEATLQRVLARGTPEGKIYALLGLQLLEPKAAESRYAKEAESQSHVLRMSGCLEWKDSTVKTLKEVRGMESWKEFAVK